MSLRKKDVYSKLSDYSRKVLGKYCSSEKTILSDKSGSSEKTRKYITSSLNSDTLSDKHTIFPKPTPPNSPNYKCIENSKPIIKTIEEPYPILETKTEVKLDPKRTSFQLCKIM